MSGWVLAPAARAASPAPRPAGTLETAAARPPAAPPARDHREHVAPILSRRVRLPGLMADLNNTALMCRLPLSYAAARVCRAVLSFPHYNGGAVAW